MDREPLPFNASLGRKIGELLEICDEVGPTVGIAGIIEGVDSDEDVVGAARFGEPQREAEKDRVSSRHVSDRDAFAKAALRNLDIGGQCRPAERTKIERENNVSECKPGSNRPRSLELGSMPLIIVNGERNHGKTLLAGDARANHRIEPAREENDRALVHSFNPMRGPAQNIRA